MQMKAKGVPIVGVQFTNDSDRSDLKASTDKASAMLRGAGNPFQTLAVDPTGDVALSFGIAGVPESFLVDAQGMIVKTTRGPLVGADADAMYDAYKAEVAKAS
jgi:cytochrome c biogenesis protein CcmG/thiol:disulfide interchange protein DsbE